MSDDDNANAAPEMQSEAEMEPVEKEDPLQLAIEDLEGRIVAQWTISNYILEFAPRRLRDLHLSMRNWQ